jgi:hypothetical protein
MFLELSIFMSIYVFFIYVSLIAEENKNEAFITYTTVQSFLHCTQNYIDSRLRRLNYCEFKRNFYVLIILTASY